MRRHRLFMILASILVVLTFVTTVLPVCATELEEKQQNKQNIDRQIEEKRSDLKQQRRDEAALKDELDRLDRRLQELQSELDEINGEISVTEENIARTEIELAAAEEEFAAKEELFKRRLRSIYEQGYVSYIDVLFGASSFGDFLTRFNNLRIIASNDQRLVEEIRAERDRIEAIKEELERQKSELEGMRRRILANREEVERVTITREAILKDLQQEIARKEKAIQDLEREAEQLDREILRLIGHYGGDGITGRLGTPLASSYRISSYFGWRPCPMSSCRVKPSPYCSVCKGTGVNYHGGIDLVPYGSTNVIAAESGEIVLARYSSSYGNYIVIDHGKGFSTLYAHLSMIAVHVGQVVARGQYIGIAGSTGASTGLHLHFEVREFDVRKNPLAYL